MNDNNGAGKWFRYRQQTIFHKAETMNYNIQQEVHRFLWQFKPQSRIARLMGIANTTLDGWFRRETFPLWAVVLHPNYDEIIEYIGEVHRALKTRQEQHAVNSLDIDRRLIDTKTAAASRDYNLFMRCKAALIKTVKDWRGDFCASGTQFDLGFEH